MEKHKDTCMVSGRDATMRNYLVTTEVVLYQTWKVEAENKEGAAEKYEEDGYNGYPYEEGYLSRHVKYIDEI